MAIVARFNCELCHQEFILVQGMELSDIAEESTGGNSVGLSMPEDSLSTLAKTRTSISVIDFINSLELHREKCGGKVVYLNERK
jgi:hypothetical protein